MSPRSIRALLVCSLFIVAAYLACHLAGWRETTSWLCRIDITIQPSLTELLKLGLYLACYAGFVLVAPVLAIAAGMLFVYTKIIGRRSGS